MTTNHHSDRGTGTGTGTLRRHPYPDFYAGGVVHEPKWCVWFKKPHDGWTVVAVAESRREADELLAVRCGQADIRNRRACVLAFREGPPREQQADQRATG